jgi:glycine/D-amino acid oxidase-like deaminating enzyme
MAPATTRGEKPGKDPVELRSGPSYWRAINGSPPVTTPLAGDTACEVAVVGGGISGALVAEHLIREGLNTLLVDEGDLAAESTSGSTGLLLYEVDTPLVELIDHVGRKQAVHAYRRGLWAIDELEKLAAAIGDSCQFERRPSLYFASRPGHRRGLEQEYACRRELGFDVRFLDGSALADIASIAAPCALWSLGNAQIDPYRFTCGVLRAAIRGGLRAHAHTRVTGVERSSDRVRLLTERGTIAARHVVYAVGYMAEQFVGRRIGKLHTTYVAASQPLESFAGWPEGCLIWESARPYFYARQTSDGRAMIGGEDTPLATDHKRDELLAAKVTKLGHRFGQLFPTLSFTPAYEWAGAFGDTRDGLAFIGRLPGRDREYHALGYGGNGITFSTIAARLITDLIVGRPNPDAEVFRFGR